MKRITSKEKHLNILAITPRKEGKAIVQINEHLQIIKQLKQQQRAQLHRNKCYKQRQLYKCGVQVTIFSQDVIAHTLLQLDLFNHSSFLRKVSAGLVIRALSFSLS